MKTALFISMTLLALEAAALLSPLAPAVFDFAAEHAAAQYALILAAATPWAVLLAKEAVR